MLIEGVRINRADLRSPSASPTPSVDPEAAEDFRACLDNVLGKFEFAEPSSAHNEVPMQEPTEEEDEVAEFRLFTSSAPARAIRIRSPSLGDQEPGFIGPGRPLSYYFAGELSEKKRSQFSQVALSGDEVIRLSRLKWHGAALPWKVVKGEQVGISSTKVAPEKKKRHGKKYRVALRKKAAAELAKKAAAEKQVEEKEAYLREKKTKKNRERQLKRRAKEKAEKEKAKLEEGGEPVSASPADV